MEVELKFGREEMERVIDDLSTEKPGYYGAFTTNEAAGAIKNGARVVKSECEDGDAHVLGEEGVVLGSIGPSRFEQNGRVMFYLYFIEWDSNLRVVCAVVDWKIKQKEEKWVVQ